MKPNLKDQPKEWRKSALLTLLGLAIISLLLRWRGIFADKTFFIVLTTLAIIAVAASLQPRWFRSYHLLSMRLGLAISQFIGYVALILFFIFILTPIGLVLRLLGKDVLQLKPPPGATTYWQPGKDSSPLDRLF
jgi:hypothetical protein